MTLKEAVALANGDTTYNPAIHSFQAAKVLSSALADEREYASMLDGTHERYSINYSYGVRAWMIEYKNGDGDWEVLRVVAYPRVGRDAYAALRETPEYKQWKEGEVSYDTY
jgi:hypothetical protein